MYKMNVYRKRLIFLLATILFIVSCSVMLYFGYKTFYIEENNNNAADNYRYHFALIAEETENAYWRLIEDGAKKAAREKEIYLEYVAPKKADNDQLLVLFDRMIAAKVDGIIIQGIEGNRFVDLVHKAIERNIPVITIDTDVKSSERKAYVGTDNYYAGQLAAQTIIQHTQGEQRVGIVMGRLDAINQKERLAGFKEEIKNAPRIEIADIKESQITKIGAAQAAYEIYKQHPSITALVGMSALDGIGIVQGMQEVAPEKELYITSFDILPETVEYIKQGDIDATISQYPKQMGRTSIDTLITLQNKDLLKNEKFIDTSIITKGNLEKLSGDWK